MKLIIGNKCFCPKLLTSLITLFLFGAFISLGLWQLDRAAQKRSLYAEFEKRQISVAIDLNNDAVLQREQETLFWQPVYASGTFIEQSQFLLDNQVEQGQAGYFVYTPFKLRKSNRIVLVNRGWVGAGVNREHVPSLSVEDGVVNIAGVIKAEPKTGLILQEAGPEKISNTVFRVQQINVKELEGETSLTLLPYILRLSPASEHGYRRQWQAPGSGESKNLGYAFQWFAFATVLMVIYLLMNIKKVSQGDL